MLRFAQHILFHAALFLCSCQVLISQDFTWWNQTHNWDGVTHWSRYIVLSPKFLGPNALPIPQIQNGHIPEQFTVDLDAQYQWFSGDKTQSLKGNVYIPIEKNKVGMQVSMIPVERFKTDTAVRDMRRARTRSAEGVSVGDLYISTFIQLLKDHDRLPDLMMTLNLRTASGNNFGDARFTDTPGYFFDVAGGKNIRVNKHGVQHIRTYFMLGLYVWQTYRTDYFQNDAFVYGAGVNVVFKHWQISQNYGGYVGYIGDGDHPEVYRLAISTRDKGLLNYRFQFEKGFRDNLYNTLSLGMRLNVAEVFK